MQAFNKRLRIGHQFIYLLEGLQQHGSNVVQARYVNVRNTSKRGLEIDLELTQIDLIQSAVHIIEDTLEAIRNRCQRRLGRVEKINGILIASFDIQIERADDLGRTT